MTIQDIRAFLELHADGDQAYGVDIASFMKLIELLDRPVITSTDSEEIASAINEMPQDTINEIHSYLNVAPSRH